MTDWSKAGRKSKNKGKAYERTIAAAMTKFTGVNFRKTPGSGGMNKQGIKIAGHIFCGDLMCDRQDFKFSVEAKNRKEFLFSQVIKNPNSAPFTSWWFQCVRDAAEYKLEPMMFFKPKPGSPDNMVVLCADDYATLIPNHYLISSYKHGPIKFSINEKSKNERKRREHIVVATLPTPIMVDWGYLSSVLDPKSLFGIPKVTSYGTVVSYD